MKIRLALLVCASLFLAALVFTILAMVKTSETAAEARFDGNNIVRAEPFGPDQAAFDAAMNYVRRSSVVRKNLPASRSRLISFQPLESESKSNEPRIPPTRFRAVFYDYSRNRDVVAEGRFDRSEPIKLSFSNDQLPPNDEEFNAAVEVVKKDRDLGSGINSKRLEVYPPMPPVLYPYDVKEKVERTIFIGLRSTNGSHTNEIVGVNMIRDKLIRYKSKAPQAAISAPDGCGLSSSGGANGRAIAGSARITISKPVGNAEQVELWDFVVNRPSSSSGTDGSAIELTDIKFKGKLMLKRLHIPVLNVKYNYSCGPFRDWQYAESDFSTPSGSTDLAPGIRFCPSPPTTIVENRSDAGNYRGVAVYNQDGATVLVTEMAAGWYRYLNEYQFLNDGTIKPRFGYGSITSSCVCIQRKHHAYWRMDFDVKSPFNRVFQVNGSDPPILESTEYTTDRTPGMKWIIQDTTTGDSVTLTPNANDGTAAGDDFAKGDFWLLTYKPFPQEVNDSPNDPSINLAPYLNGESTDNSDIVIWYGTHIQRSDDTSFANDPLLNGTYTPGPDIKANW